MTTNSNFNFITNTMVTLELPFPEHIEELRQRIFLLFWIILLLTCIAFIEVKDLVKILELPVQNVKFFQLSPGEYFISTIKIPESSVFPQLSEPGDQYRLFSQSPSLPFTFSYSHSIVEGGLELISYTTLFIPLTLLIISLEISPRNS